ncbi:MAG TPA: sulfatase-like hydrolase/transferase [Terriglobales bacterium]|nr:sulfatase-like hydrolase/transferase [Terriglobales bacterium]
MVDSLFLMRFPRWLSLVLLCAFASAANPQRPSGSKTPPRHPNIILITLDTTRADRMDFLGSNRGLTPNLDTVAKQGIVFTRAYSHVPLTTASHTTILTGTYPQFNHVNDFGIPISPHLPYLPDLLHHQGYHTAAFVASLVLDPLDGTAPGFDRGFDFYDAGFSLRRHGADRYRTVERRGSEVVNRALAWLSQNHTNPFFVWVHLYDAHDPYDPPEPFKTKYKSQPYDGEIAYADSAVGKLLDTLREHNLYDGTLIALMADHGESLGAHGENTHGIFLYDETLHVPLVVKLPGNRDAGTRVETRAQLVDVTPTILQIAGIQAPKEIQGESLLKLLPVPGEKQAVIDRPAYSETDYPRRAFGWSSLRALRTGKYLYVASPDRELYNQETDPAELHNLASDSKAVAQTLGSQLDAFREKTSQTLVELAKPDPEQMKKLQALGYVASEETKITHSEVGGIDPKSKVEVSNLLHDAMFEVEDAQYTDAIPKLEQVLKDQPGMAIAEMQLGLAYSRLRTYDKALAHLKNAVKLLPDNGMGHYELGLALFETGDWNAAAPEFEAAVARAPRWADAHFSLASVYARIDRVPDAMTELDTCLSISPDHYRANLLRGRILSLQGNPVAAVSNLQKAAEVQPDSREAHLFLADAYGQLGRVFDAERERGIAQKLGGPTNR